MATTLATINSLVNDRRRDTSNNVIDMTGDGFRAVNGALQVWTQQHDWPWQQEKLAINYNPGITYYPISSSLNFKAIIDLKPTRTDEIRNELYYISGSKFDSDNIHSWKFALHNEAQQQYIRIRYDGWSTPLNQATSLSGNGTWVGATAISNVATDQYEFLDETASVKFDYSGTSGTITNSTMNAVDVSRYAQRSTIYFNVFLQSVTNFTSITLKAGTDSSNYITGSMTTDYLGNTPVVGWNKFKLQWNGSTTVVGTLDTSSFAYIQATIAYSSNPSTVSNRIENFFISEDVPMLLDYYSTNMTVDVSASNAKGQIFNDSAATSDTTTWTGTWDYVNEAFVNSVMEIVSWMTGEMNDRNVAIQRIQGYVEPIKSRLPSKRRYAEMAMSPDLNGPGPGPAVTGRRRFFYGPRG